MRLPNSSTASSVTKKKAQAIRAMKTQPISALEELTTALENGHGSLATCSGMTALQIAISSGAD